MTHAFSLSVFDAYAFCMDRCPSVRAASLAPTSLERALVRLLALGYELEDAAKSVGPDRCGGTGTFAGAARALRCVEFVAPAGIGRASVLGLAQAAVPAA